MADIPISISRATVSKRESEGARPVVPPPTQEEPQDPVIPANPVNEGPKDYIPSTGSIRFDEARKYGYNGTPVNGNLTIDVAGAWEINMAKVLHNGTAPTINKPAGVTLHLSGGEYEPNVNNEILFICHKNDSGQVTRVSYSVSPNQLSV